VLLNIIFLDIDGVMNNSGTAYTTLRGSFDPVPTRCLKDILRATGAKIVVSGAMGRAMPFEELRAYFRRHDIDGETVIGTTTYHGGTRGQDISRWLEDHPGIATAYILIDDAGLDQVTPHGTHLVCTQWHVGMTPGHARQAIRLLNKQRHP
jgi:hypothetical protein